MSSQKFIARNRAPRVQIEYDVELYGAQKKVQLPFVMGVLSDLSGNPKEPLPAVADRKFLEIIDNGKLDELDKWSNAFIAGEGGNSAHEIRTWVAAFAALAAAGPYETGVRYYRAVPELIAGFAVRTAVIAA